MSSLQIAEYPLPSSYEDVTVTLIASWEKYLPKVNYGGYMVYVQTVREGEVLADQSAVSVHKTAALAYREMARRIDRMEREQERGPV
jgi:hypothetical protein